MNAADLLTALRLPLAAAFVLAAEPASRLALLLTAGLTDVLDGLLARRLGPSRLGSFLDPVADKLFMVCAVGTVAASGALRWWEVAALLVRDAVATVAFLVTAAQGAAAAIPARLAGKAVTVLQMAALLAFLLVPALLRPLAWAAGAVGLVAIWDYTRAAPRERRRL